MTPLLHHLRLRRPVRDLHRCHQIVWNAAGGSALWSQPRLDLLVVSAPAVAPGRDVASVSSHPLHETVAGERVRFALIACPTTMEGATRKRRVLPAEAWEGWLARKLDGALTVESLHADRLGPRVGVKHGQPMTHVWVQFSGSGRVIDPGLLMNLRVTGIGSGKAHGAGLLVVGPQ